MGFGVRCHQLGVLTPTPTTQQTPRANKCQRGVKQQAPRLPMLWGVALGLGFGVALLCPINRPPGATLGAHVGTTHKPKPHKWGCHPPPPPRCGGLPWLPPLPFSPTFCTSVLWLLHHPFRGAWVTYWAHTSKAKHWRLCQPPPPPKGGGAGF